MIMGLDRTYHVHQFIFSFFPLHFLFIPCGRLSWLSVSFLLHVKYTVSYRNTVIGTLAEWPLMGELVTQDLVQQGEAWAGSSMYQM